MKIPIDDLLWASGRFREANNTTDALIGDLETTMRKLQDSWEDAGQQVFFSYYQEWRDSIGAFPEILAAIARELDSLAQRYADADEHKFQSS